MPVEFSVVASLVAVVALLAVSAFFSQHRDRAVLADARATRHARGG